MNRAMEVATPSVGEGRRSPVQGDFERRKARILSVWSKWPRMHSVRQKNYPSGGLNAMTHVRNRLCERLFQWVSTAAFLVLLPAVALGEPPAKVDFDIPAQSLESALQQVARTQRVQILFSENDVKGVTTAGVKGVLSTFEAVQKLVEGTGLTAVANQNNAIAIKPLASNSRGGQ